MKKRQLSTETNKLVGGLIIINLFFYLIFFGLEVIFPGLIIKIINFNYFLITALVLLIIINRKKDKTRRNRERIKQKSKSISIMILALGLFLFLTLGLALHKLSLPSEIFFLMIAIITFWQISKYYERIEKYNSSKMQ